MRWQVAQWFEKRWWSHYLRNRNPSEYLDWKRGYWARFIEELDIAPIGRILDAGCGPAGVFTILHEFEVWAIDPLLDEYEQNISVFSMQDYANVHFVKCQIESLDFDVQFDQIFCINVINHVKDIDDSLARLHGIATKDSQLIITTDCHRNRVYKWLLKVLPLDILHPHQLSTHEYASKLVEAGWRIEKTTKLKRDFIFDYYAFVCRKD